MNTRSGTAHRRVVLVVLVAVVMALGQVPVAAQAVMTTISGYVYQANGTTGAAGVRVYATGNTTHTEYMAFVQAGGVWSIPVSASETYEIRFDPNDFNNAGNLDYLLEYYPNVHLYDAGYPASIAAVSAGASGLTTILDVGGRITGTVYNTEGTVGLSGLRVEGQDLGDFQVWANTVMGGYYTLHGVPTALETVYVGFMPNSSANNYNAAHGTEYLDEFYYNAYFLDRASAVTAGLWGIDARLDTPVSFTGHVSDSVSGELLSGVEVRAVDPIHEDWVFWSAVTDSSGFYQMETPPNTSIRLVFDATTRNSEQGTSYITEWYDGAAGSYTASGALVVDTGMGRSFGTQMMGQDTVRAEQSAAAFTNSGSWSTWSNASLSGGSYQYGNSNGTSTLIQFDGTKLTLLARTGPDFGIAAVSIDGGPPQQVDLYSSTSLYRQAVWNTGVLAAGLHSVRVTWTGAPSPGHTGTYINVDAADITRCAYPPLLGNTLYEQSDPKLVYQGAWSTWSGDALSGGSYAYANSAGSAVTAQFSGPRLDLVARTGPEFGYALVTVDDGVSIAPRLVDLYSPTTGYRKVVFSTWELTSPAVHTVRVQWTGLKCPASTGTYINADAFEVVTDLEQAGIRVEETGPVFDNGLYTWSTWSNPALSGGSYQFTNQANASTKIVFQGTRLKLYSRTGPEFGKMLVGCDAPPTIYKDLYRIANGYQTMVYDTGTLSAGWHTVTIKSSGEKNTFSSGTYINVDAIEITPATPPAISGETLVQESNASLVSQGPWSSWSYTPLSGGTYAFSNSIGAQIYTTFAGTRVDIVARKGPEFGYMRVVVDDTIGTLVDLYAPESQYQETVLSSWTLDPGKHSVSVSWSGLKNPASTGTYVNLDALKIVGTLSPPITRREQTDPTFSFGSGWSTWTNAMLSGGSYAYTNTTGATTTVTGVSGGEVYLVARKGPEFGKVEVFVDDVSKGTYSLYNAKTLYQQRIAGITLTPGTHTVKFKCTGTKDSPATGTYINVDRIEIEPAP